MLLAIFSFDNIMRGEIIESECRYIALAPAAGAGVNKPLRKELVHHGQNPFEVRICNADVFVIAQCISLKKININ